MKTIHKSLILIVMLVLSSTSLLAQNITLSFENSQITNDGFNDFYEVDVLIASDADYIQGSGQFFLDYNTLAFGENVQAAGAITYERPLTSILGSQTVSVDNYNSFVVNDNITSRVSFLWQQFWSSGAIGTNNITATPTLLVHVKIQFIDSSQDPMVCFDADSNPAFNDQFFTACGPATFAGADCFTNPGIQILDYLPNCAGSALPNCALTTTWDGASWDNGAPDSTTMAIINGNYNTATVGASIDACELTVNTGFALIIGDGGYLSVQGDITVEGTLDVQHQGSVVQVDDTATVTNNGSITVRKTTPFLETKDFMIMGSPMTMETREGVYGAGRLVLRHITANFDPHPDIAAASPGAENFADATGNDWTIQTGLLNPGEGYFVRPQPDRVTTGTFDLDYTLGTLNSGTISYNVEFNGTQIGSPNILGNPYPSAIDTDAFMAANTMIDVVYFWEHLTAPSPTYPGFLPNNFDMGDISSYSAGSGGLAAANGGATPGQFMASGQGFGIKASAAGTAVFTNAMRVTGPNDTYRNTETITSMQRDRIWLNITNDTYSLGSNILVAFVEGASNTFESYYDTKRLATPVSMYSILEDKSELGIQGREAFSIEQEIQLGFSTQIAETQNYTISIREIEGINITQTNVYLQDKELNTFTNLSEENYSFTSVEGIQDNRFVLLFKDKILDTQEFESSLSTITVYPVPATNTITLSNPQSLELKKATIFDLQGRVVIEVNLSETITEKTIDISGLNSAMYLLVIETTNSSITKRIIKK